MPADPCQACSATTEISRDRATGRFELKYDRSVYVVLVLVAILSTLAPMHARTMLASLPTSMPSQPLLELQQPLQQAASQPTRQILSLFAVTALPASLLASAAPSPALPLPSPASLVLNYAPNAP